MTKQFEAWAESFHFSEDLKDLEAVYQQQQQESITRQVEANQNGKARKQSSLEDESLLDQLAQNLAGRLLHQLNHSELSASLMQHAELIHDNTILARQVEELLKLVEQKDQDLVKLRENEQRYTRIFGKIYHKAE